MTHQPRAADEVAFVLGLRDLVRYGVVDGVDVLQTWRDALEVLDHRRDALRDATTRADDAEARVVELEALLEERAASHLADLERVEERCNREGAVHRHEAQAATADAIEARGQARTLRERVGQLEAELAAQQSQTCAVARSATRAEQTVAGLTLVADGWRRIAEARA